MELQVLSRATQKGDKAMQHGRWENGPGCDHCRSMVVYEGSRAEALSVGAGGVCAGMWGARDGVFHWWLIGREGENVHFWECSRLEGMCFFRSRGKICVRRQTERKTPGGRHWGWKVWGELIQKASEWVAKGCRGQVRIPPAQSVGGVVMVIRKALRMLRF